MSVLFTRRGKPQWIQPIFSDNSWRNIIMACQSNQVPDTWNIADSKAMTINGTDYQIDIIGKNHDTYSDGSGTAPLTFQFHDCYENDCDMEDTDTNANGWDGCVMRNTHLPAIKILMPVEVQNAIRRVDKLTSAGNESATIVTSTDELFLLSEVEVYGSATCSFAGEGNQYEYYYAGNSKAKEYMGAGCEIFLRSPSIYDDYAFCFIYGSEDTPVGEIDVYGATSGFGIAPAFCF